MWSRVALRRVPQAERIWYPVMKSFDQSTLVHPPCNFLWGNGDVTSARIFQEKRLV